MTIKKEEFQRMWPGKRTGMVCPWCQDTCVELIQDKVAFGKYVLQCPSCNKDVYHNENNPSK